MKWHSILLTLSLSLILIATACSDLTKGVPTEGEEADAQDSSNDFAQLDLAAACPISVDPAKELLIRDLSVVNDPVRTNWTGSLTDPADGAWHFGRLMANMAGDRDVSDFIRRWLANWESDRAVNGFVVPNRRNAIRQKIIDAWPKLPNGKLDPAKAPFRLLAIVNRMDLRNVRSGNAGEGRFVFGALDPQGAALHFTVILEYKLLASTQGEALRWAEDWHALGALTGPDFNSALQALSDRFTGKDIAPRRPNGSAISQVRTNEVSLGNTNLWEMREHVVAQTSSGRLGNLVLHSLNRTPDVRFRATDRLARFVNQTSSSILRGTFSVPTVFENERFRAGSILYDRTGFWNGDGVTPITNLTARHLFSVNTCDGCHAHETGTVFLHVAPRGPNSLASLSSFMTGTSVIDPVTGESRNFNDLERRSTDLKNLLCPSSSTQALQQTTQRIH